MYSLAFPDMLSINRTKIISDHEATYSNLYLILNYRNIKDSAVIRLNRKSLQPMLFANSNGFINKSYYCKNRT